MLSPTAQRLPGLLHLHSIFQPATRITMMPILPSPNASDDEWRAFAEERCEELMPHMAEYILERFAYKPRFVQQRVWRTFSTVSALSIQFDIYIRMFVKPNAYWPRECLILARIGFKKERAGHGRALVKHLVELAPKFGYRYLAIESANPNSSAFAERLGFSPYDNGRHWIGTVEAIKDALEDSRQLA